MRSLCIATRVSLAHHNYRKSTYIIEDPAQPKKKKIYLTY